MALKRKLIEVALPLEAINRESAREKSIRHGHPSTLHLWWARRPLAAARAVLFAQLVDDPSAHPEEFPDEESQRRERDRLHALIERLVVWENTRDEALLAEAHAEILRSTGGNPPPILDPFAGGGTIPLEAQRLGLEAHASDLNPVAVLINKALIEIPPKFADQPPVFSGLAGTRTHWKGAEGLAADVRAYGAWMRDEAQRRIGHLYPDAVVSAPGVEPVETATVIAWIWARTVTCPNPACGIEMPLVRSWWLGKKKGKEAYVVPTVVGDPTHPSGLRVDFEIGHDASGPQGVDGTVSGLRGALCLACSTAVPVAYLRTEWKAARGSQQLIATVAEGSRRRVYVAPSKDHRDAAAVARPSDVPLGRVGHDPRAITTPNYGLTEFADLFTHRQLMALTTLSDLVGEARERVLADGATTSYADAVATYLGVGVSRFANYCSAMGRWRPDAGKEQVGDAFGRQAISMVWDFAESNVFSASAGGWAPAFRFVEKAVDWLSTGVQGRASQRDASAGPASTALISTDPPYYDNIGYSDLSDFFYVWLRRSLRDVHPELLSTMLVPKAEELVANPYRHDGKAGAKAFFEEGFRQVFARARASALPDYPITVYYAFKQSDTDAAGTASTGWETLLDGMVRSGWEITSTWPMRSELANRMRSLGSNALASSIVLSLRPRDESAPTTDRRGFIATLRSELPDALRHLQQGQIAPVDLPQAAIGPGMAVFSRYAHVLEADGSPMTVRAALARINEILDEVLSEQEGDFDAVTRFCLAWYRTHGYGLGAYGDADNLARARVASLDQLDREGVLTARAGKVRLCKPNQLGETLVPLFSADIPAWVMLHHLVAQLEEHGVADAGVLVRQAETNPHSGFDADLVKELAFLLFSIAEKNGWTQDALSFNRLATSWPDIVEAAKAGQPADEQGALAYDEDDS